MRFRNLDDLNKNLLRPYDLMNDRLICAAIARTLEPERFSGWEAALLEERVRNSLQYQKAKNYYTGLFSGCEPDCLPLPDMQEDAEERVIYASS